jgi:predicted RND superfamily exporter protein
MRTREQMREGPGGRTERDFVMRTLETLAIDALGAISIGALSSCAALLGSDDQQTPTEQLVANQNALYAQQAAMIRQHYQNYFQGLNSLLELYKRAQTPEQIAEVDALAKRMEQREDQWEYQQQQEQEQQASQQELEDYHQQVLDRLDELLDQIQR